MRIWKSNPNYNELNTDRFWSYVDKSGGNDACWIWTGDRTERGYGAISWKGKASRSHRISWLLTHGEIPDGLLVLHDCPDGDNPSCVNPSHLWLGTNADNVRDSVHKKRWFCHQHPEQIRKGEQVHSAKLADPDIPRIRQLLAEGKTINEISALYRVGASTIQDINKGRTWKHVK